MAKFRNAVAGRPAAHEQAVAVPRRAALKTYIVTLEPPRPNAPVGRAEVVGANRERTAAFIGRLKELIADRGLTDQAGQIGDPMSLPFVAISCTPRLASIIRKMPDVESVVEDAPLMTYSYG